MFDGDAVTPPLVKSAVTDFLIESFDFGDTLVEVRSCCWVKLARVDASVADNPGKV